MRKYFLDNVRFIIVMLVILYHICYMFNSVGVIGNVNIQGIPQMDVLLYILYPWFMCALFVIAGVSARYALMHHTGKEFLKLRVRKLLVPSIAGTFLYGWIGGYITNQYTDMFIGQGSTMPGFFKYLIYCASGTGPLWFIQELFLVSLVLLLIRKIDKKDKLYTLGGKVNLIVLFLLVLPVWGSSFLLNTPVIVVFRNGIYLFMFLLGFYVFSHDEVQELLQKVWYIFLPIAIGGGIWFTVTNWGQSYADDAVLTKFSTNMFAWFAILAIFGCGRKWLNKETAFTRYMRPRNFAFYLLHYPIMVLNAYLLDKYVHPAPILYYVFLLILEIIFLPLITELVKRIPVIKRLVLGE